MEDGFRYFEEGSFSSLFKSDIRGGDYAFLMSYPSTASWSPYPNTSGFFIQDGNLEEKKVGFDKIRQKEPWKIMAVLGDGLPGILTSRPPDELIRYWKDHFGFGYENMTVLPHDTWGHILNEEKPFGKIITLFPYDRILPELHAINPDAHYYLLGKCSLAEICPSVPGYTVVDLRETPPENAPFPSDFPYAVKTSHGLSGEGTYIIKSGKDLKHCIDELRLYANMNLVEKIVIMDFVSDAIGNYCVQFYVNKTGGVTLIGTTSQLVSATGVHMGGIIRYRETDMTPFFPIIRHVARSVSEHGYFGVVGVDILEDTTGNFHVIDANIRVNGSTPLCLQRHALLSLGKETAKYSTDYAMDCAFDDILTRLKPELDRKDFIILSAVEYPSGSRTRTEIYGITTGEDKADMLGIEKMLMGKGLRLMA